jgi:hypothetical protein
MRSGNGKSTGILPLGAGSSGYSCVLLIFRIILCSQYEMYLLLSAI